MDGKGNDGKSLKELIERLEQMKKQAYNIKPCKNCKECEDLTVCITSIRIAIGELSEIVENLLKGLLKKKVLDLNRFIHKFVACSSSEISKKAIDYFSIFHVLFGMISYLIGLFIVGLFPISIDTIGSFSIIVVINGAIIWEFLENWLFIKIKLKKKRDSLQNSLCDIIFTFIGSLIAFLCNDIYYILIIIQNLITIGAVWRYVTKKK